MALNSWFIFLLVFSLCSCEDCVLDNRTPDLSWEVKLHKDLNKCAGVYLPPVQGEDAVVEVNLRFILNIFNLDDEDIFTTYSWVMLRWYDGRLSWKPEDYAGINQAVSSAFFIWTPALKLHNSFNEDFFDGMYSSFDRCIVRNTGNVSCVRRMIYQTVCNSNLRHWPFDTQACTLSFGEWQQPLVKTQFNIKGINFNPDPAQGSGWVLRDYKTEKTPNKTEQLSLTYILEREAQGLVIYIVMPLIVVSVLTIVSLVLDVNNIRLFVSCLSLLLHYDILQEISFFIPKHSFESPTILLLVRSSVILTLFSILLTSFLKYVGSTERPMYVWAKSVNNFVYNSKYQCIIWPRWKHESNGTKILKNVSDDNNRKEWLDLASLINFVCVIMYSVLYLIFFLVYMPFKH